MSDLKATSSQAQTAAPITAIASGKLRAFAGTGPLFADTDGLVDAFAEVFARIAASSSQPIEPPDSGSETESGQLVDNNQPERAEDDAPPRPELPAASARVPAGAVPLKRAALLVLASLCAVSVARADQIREIALAEGTPWETTAYLRRAAKPGPTVMVVGGMQLYNEWVRRGRPRVVLPVPVAGVAYAAWILALVILSPENTSPFIYFQF